MKSTHNKFDLYLINHPVIAGIFCILIGISVMILFFRFFKGSWVEIKNLFNYLKTPNDLVLTDALANFLGCILMSLIVIVYGVILIFESL